MHGIYIGPTPIVSYSCVLCQREHRLGLDPEFQPHIYHQSKHGVQRRAPLNAAEQFAASVQAEDRQANREKGINESW